MYYYRRSTSSVTSKLWEIQDFDDNQKRVAIMVAGADPVTRFCVAALARAVDESTFYFRELNDDCMKFISIKIVTEGWVHRLHVRLRDKGYDNTEQYSRRHLLSLISEHRDTWMSDAYYGALFRSIRGVAAYSRQGRGACSHQLEL
eukprot:11399-Heterococcus_DN1.PRE.6